MLNIKNEPGTKTLPLNVVQPSASSSSCCSTTDDGAAICIVPENGAASSCGCSDTAEETAESADLDKPQKQTTLRGKVRSGILFAVACLASPCCTPLYVPLLLVLLAGTPAAVWLSTHVGWVYGILTIVSIISFVLAWRWWPKLSNRRQADTAVSVNPQSLPQTTYSLEEIS